VRYLLDLALFLALWLCCAIPIALMCWALDKVYPVLKDDDE
jgi:hypothetical protein